MSLFGGLIGGLIGGVGEILGGRERERASERALEASRPVSVFGPTGAARFQDDQFRLSLAPALQEQLGGLRGLSSGLMGDLGGLDFAGREAAELSRLRTLRQPQIDQARASLQERLLARGRTGFARGGGLSGRMFQPESAALEEAILRTDLGDIGAARTMSQEDQRFLLQQLQGIMGLEQTVQTAPEHLAAIGIGAAPPAAIAGLQAMPGIQRGQFFNDLFGSLGSAVGGAIPRVRMGGLFL